MYTGISSGKELAIGGTLTRLQTGPKAISSSGRGKNSKLIIEGWCEKKQKKRAKDNPPNATKNPRKSPSGTGRLHEIEEDCENEEVDEN